MKNQNDEGSCSDVDPAELFMLERREKIRELLLGTKRIKVPAGWHMTAEEACDAFANSLLFGSLLGHKRKDLYPTASQMLEQLTQIRKRIAALDHSLGAASSALEYHMDLILNSLFHHPDRFSPPGTFQLEYILRKLDNKLSALADDIEAGDFQSPSLRELRVHFIMEMMRGYEKSFGKLPKISREGPFFRVVQWILAEDARDYSTAIYDDARKAQRQLRSRGE